MDRKLKEIINASNKDPDTEEVIHYLEKKRQSGEIDEVIWYIKRRLGVSINKKDIQRILFNHSKQKFSYHDELQKRGIRTNDMMEREKYNRPKPY